MHNIACKIKIKTKALFINNSTEENFVTGSLEFFIILQLCPV